MSYDNDDLSDDPENPDPSDMDADDYTITIRCPNCRKFIDEDSEICPRCGFYLSVEEKSLPDRTWIFVLIVVIVLAAFIFVWVLR